MKKYPPSQDEVLDGFLRPLNEKRGTQYKVIGRPDEVERRAPEVDYILRDETCLPEIAVEISTTWRSEEAGREDAAWTKWTEAVRAQVRGQVHGEFYIVTPMTVPRGVSPDPFAADLLELLRRETSHLASLYQEGKSGLFDVHGMKVMAGLMKDEGSDISFARSVSEEDKQEFPVHVNRLVAKKSEKLRKHKEAGRETWLVVYNTFWAPISPVQVRDVVLVALEAGHDHIDHFGVVIGNPPDDVYLHVIR